MAMELEYVIKMIILVIVSVVIIGMIITFRGSITDWWTTTITPEKNPPPDKLEPIKGEFDDREIANFIEGCWSSNNGRNEDVNCYFLMGEFDVTKNGILGKIDQSIISKKKIVINIPSGAGALVISYDNYQPDVGSEAIVVKG